MDRDEDIEGLGEQLYDLIFPMHPEMAGKLTGMLLELPGPILNQILQDGAMLTGALEKAFCALHEPHKFREDPDKEAHADDTSVSSDSLGEQLFELVDVYNTGHTQKITGMLLEQHKEVLLHLLSEPTSLEEQVHLALKTLKEQEADETDASASSEVDDTETVGERLFALVEEMDAAHAADITGMLLEMDPETLSQMLSDRTMLEVAVAKARTALGSLS